jgi:hypothetical protein
MVNQRKTLIYALKYTDANYLTTERWCPRFGEFAGDHTVITLVMVPQKASAARSLHL